MAEAKGAHVPVDDILRKLNEDPAYKDKFYNSPSTFFEEELGMKMSPERRQEIDRIYAEVGRQVKDRRFILPGGPRPGDPCI